MPSNATAKTKWALSLTVALLIVAGVAVWVAVGQANTVTMRAGTHRYTLEVARSPQARAKGLGGRTSLPSNHGMLFVFGATANQCFWMRDTKLPLDILWLDSHKQVIAVQASVQPSSYPNTFCNTGRYVIELKAGQIAAAHIHPGQRLSF